MFESPVLVAKVARLQREVAAHEQTIRLLCERLGIDPVVDPATRIDDEEQRLIEAGKVVEAIKHHRQRTGSGLKEAKDVIDAHRD